MIVLLKASSAMHATQTGSAAILQWAVSAVMMRPGRRQPDFPAMCADLRGVQRQQVPLPRGAVAAAPDECRGHRTPQGAADHHRSRYASSHTRSSISNTESRQPLLNRSLKPVCSLHSRICHLKRLRRLPNRAVATASSKPIEEALLCLVNLPCSSDVSRVRMGEAPGQCAAGHWPANPACSHHR